MAELPGQEELLALLAELLACHGPAGDEREIDIPLLREFRATGARVWQDGADNIIAHLPGREPRVMVAAHKDELGMVISDLLADGRARVHPLGGLYPWKIGEGPVDLLADDGNILRAILSVGSLHTRRGILHELKERRALTWEQVTLFSGLGRAETLARGVHVGSRAVIARERKILQRLPGELIASFALDDRMGLVSIIAALRALARNPPGPELFMVATSGEETGFSGALRAARALAPELVIALDTSPVTPETPTRVDERPVVWYGEAAWNSKTDSDRLLQLAGELGFGAQPVVYEAAGSDAGGIKRAGLAARSLAFGFARENSHGCEIAHAGSLGTVTELLLAFLRQL